MSGAEAAGPRIAHSAPAPDPADIGIVAALSVEVGFLRDRLTGVRTYSGPRHTVIEGECGDKLIALIVAGPGRAAARRGTQVLLDGHRPRWVLSAGFGGALNPQFARNDIMLAYEVLDLEGYRYTIDVSVPPSDRGPRIWPGRLLTVDRIIRTAAEKAELRLQYEADAVDMESAAVAAVCSVRNVRFLSIRVVSDEAGIDLPPEVAMLMARSASYQAGAALRAIWRRPSSLKDFWKLYEHAQEAADRLAAFTLGALEQLN